MMAIEKRKEPDELLEHQDVQRRSGSRTEGVPDHAASENPPGGETSEVTDKVELPDLSDLPPASDLGSADTAAADWMGTNDAATVEGEKSGDAGPESANHDAGVFAELAGVPLSALNEEQLLALSSESLARAEATASAFVRDLVYRPDESSSTPKIEPLPYVRGQEPAIELFGDENERVDPMAGARAAGEAPVSYLEPARAASTSADVQRLAIEVEVTLANGQRVTQIAVDKSKDEFKRLAAEAVSPVRHDLREFRESYRAVWGR